MYKQSHWSIGGTIYRPYCTVHLQLWQSLGLSLGFPLGIASVYMCKHKATRNDCRITTQMASLFLEWENATNKPSIGEDTLIWEAGKWKCCKEDNVRYAELTIFFKDGQDYEPDPLTEVFNVTSPCNSRSLMHWKVVTSLRRPWSRSTYSYCVVECWKLRCGDLAVMNGNTVNSL